MLRVFRDESNLAASPELWPSIEAALERSEWFILLASPLSAKSVWVRREVQWWKQNRSTDRMLIALTDGQIGWSTRGIDWTRTNALPVELDGAFGHEPMWIDLRALRPLHRDPEAGADLKLGDMAAEFAAPIRGVPKDTLVGAHVVQQRRTRRIVRATIATLTTLAVAASVVSVIAVDQRDKARTQARIATARQLAATSTSLRNSRLDLAQLLAVEAVRLQDDFQTRAALFGAVTASPALVRYLPVGANVTTVGGSRDGTTVAAGTIEGRVLRWNVAGGPAEVVGDVGSPVAAVSLSADGSTIAATGASKAVLWSRSAGVRQLDAGAAVGGSVAVTPSGRFVASLGASTSHVVLLDLRTGRRTERTLEFSATRLVMTSDTDMVAASDSGQWERLKVPQLDILLSSPDSPMGVHGFAATLSPNGEYFTFTNSGATLSIWPTAGKLTDEAELLALSHGSDPQALAVSSDGERAAIADAGTIYISQIGSGAIRSDVQIPLTGGGAVLRGGLTFLGDSDHLVSASGSSLVLWDLNQLTRIGDTSRVPVPWACMACTEPRVSLSPDGTKVAISGKEGATIALFDTTTNRAQAITSEGATESFNLVGWNRDGSMVYLTAAEGIQARPASALSQVHHTLPEEEDQVLAVSPDERSTVVHVDGRIEIRRADGSVERTLTPPTDVQGLTDTIIDPDRRMVATRTIGGTSDPGVLMFDLNGGDVRAVGEGDVRDVGFSGGRLVVQRQTGVVELWDVGATSPVRTIAQDANYMTEGAMTRSRPAVGGDLLAQRRSDGTVAITDLRDGELLGILDLPVGTDTLKTALTITPDGRKLITVTEADPPGDDGLVVEWNLSAESWAGTACATAGRDLTDAEWRRYAGTLDRNRRTCDATTWQPASGTPGAAPASSPSDPPQLPPLDTDLADGRHPVYIKAVDAAEQTVEIDLAEVLTGAEAREAWTEDHPGSADGPPDGRVIRNLNPRLRTLRVVDPVTLTRVDGHPRVPTTSAVALTDLERQLEAKSMYWLTMSQRRATRLEQDPG